MTDAKPVFTTQWHQEHMRKGCMKHDDLPSFKFSTQDKLRLHLDAYMHHITQCDEQAVMNRN
jgi:hypothetical protein